MINETKQTLLIVTENDGEVISKIYKGESCNIRSELQTKIDKQFSPRIKLFKGRFLKVMEKEEEILDYFSEAPMTYLVLNKLKHYLEYNSNFIKKNGKRYNIQDMAQDLNISRQMMRIHINRLKDIKLLIEVKDKNGTFLAMNPYYIFKGNEIPKKIIDLFPENLGISGGKFCAKELKKEGV